MNNITHVICQVYPYGGRSLWWYSEKGDEKAGLEENWRETAVISCHDTAVNQTTKIFRHAKK